MPIRPSSRRRSLHTRYSGFTIIEVLFAITIVAILTSLAAPAFTGFVATQRIRAASSDLSSALMLARSEAIKRNRSVVLSPQGGDWAGGWSMLAGTTAVARHEAFGNLAIAGPTANVTYTADGRVVAPVARFAITSTVTARSVARCIRIDLTGLVSAFSGPGCP